jgi:hypothetical protein
MSTFRIWGLVFLALLSLVIPAASYSQGVSVGIGISVHVAPPALPVYVQPAVPGPGYIWTPGYWAYGDDDYYWVPGTWVLAPTPGFLWTPGYWGFAGGVYGWHVGYWGPHIGFYGGVNYGFGYGGVGFEGGYWNHGVFAYNRSVTNISNTTVINNTYNKTVVVNNTNSKASFNGPGGSTAQPTSAEQAAANEKHVEPTSEQTQHEHASLTNPQQKASVNGGKPAVAATPKPGQFSGKGVVAANKAGAPYHPQAANAAVKSDRPASAQAKTANTNRPNTQTANTNRPNTQTSANKSVATTSSNKPKTATSTNSSHPSSNQNVAHTQTSKPAAQPKPAPKAPAHPSESHPTKKPAR